MAVTKQNAREFHQELLKALHVLESKYDVRISTGSLRYGASEARVSVNVEYGPSKPSTEGLLPPVGTKFILAHHLGTFELIGFNPRAPKYFLRMKNLRTGKEYRCSRDTLREAVQLK